MSRTDVLVECKSLRGKTILVPQSDLALRLSVYGVVIAEGKVLLVSGRTSRRLWFPGGGVNVGEPLRDTLTREFVEETGIEVGILDKLAFNEEFFYHDVWKQAFHSFRFYFLCRPLSVNLIADELVLDGESERPRWYDMKTLDPSAFDQPHGYDILAEAVHCLDISEKRITHESTSNADG